MRRKPDLHIRFFNEFSISSPFYEYAPSEHNSTQLTLLISYLVANQDTKVPKDVLMSMLWPDVTDKVPVGALRNLVYRARKELENLYPDQDIDYIKFTQDAYFWNPDLYCKIDIVDFENYFNLAKQEPDAERQYRYYYRMQRLYTGAFLSNHAGVEWVQCRNSYYHNMYVNCTLNMCEYLYDNSRYDELLSLCDQSIIYDPGEERFYRYKLLAYLGMNTVSTALDYYQFVVDFFTAKYGMDVSASLRDIYQDILLRMPNMELKLHDLESTLGLEKDDEKTFYCNFDIFKNIYQFNLRSIRRVQGKPYLLLLSVLPNKKEKSDSVRVKKIMEALYALLSENLRKNDVFTRASLNQYSVLLTVMENIDIEVIKERICSAFDEINPDPDFYLLIEQKPME